MKQVLADAGVPTARHRAFGADDEAAALAYLEELAAPYVVKTDGLAGGKGVVVTESLAEARDAVRAYLSGEAFGDAGRTLVIEEGLTGPELSLLVVCNGDPDAAIPLAPAQDFKRSLAGDAGPNTGGMGAYSPVPIVSDALVDEVMELAVRPTLRWLADHGAEYRGVLYAGMMLTADGPKVIEYNVRFGDPECQVVLPRVTSDVAELLLAAATGDKLAVTFSDDAAVTVVLAADGYPGVTAHRRPDHRHRGRVRGQHRHRLPRRHRPRRTRSPPHRRRSRPDRHRHRRRPRSRPHARLRSRLDHQLQGHALPPRHRRPRGRGPTPRNLSTRRRRHRQ